MPNNKLLPFSVEFLIKSAIGSNRSYSSNYEKLANTQEFVIGKYSVYMGRDDPLWYISKKFGSSSKLKNYDFKNKKFIQWKPSHKLNKYQEEHLLVCLWLVREWEKLDYNGKPTGKRHSK